LARYLVEIKGQDVYINSNDLVADLSSASAKSSRMRGGEKAGKRPENEE
jgi:hypothetical protein